MVSSPTATWERKPWPTRRRRGPRSADGDAKVWEARFRGSRFPKDKLFFENRKDSRFPLLAGQCRFSQSLLTRKEGSNDEDETKTIRARHRRSLRVTKRRTRVNGRCLGLGLDRRECGRRQGRDLLLGYGGRFAPLFFISLRKILKLEIKKPRNESWKSQLDTVKDIRTVNIQMSIFILLHRAGFNLLKSEGR